MQLIVVIQFYAVWRALRVNRRMEGCCNYVVVYCSQVNLSVHHRNIGPYVPHLICVTNNCKKYITNTVMKCIYVGKTVEFQRTYGNKSVLVHWLG